jgi:predicted ester cyclase
MSVEDNKRVVARFVEVCQNQHDLAAADAMFHPGFVNHHVPEGRPRPPTTRPAENFQRFYGMFLQAFPDATMQIEEQIAERDLVVTRKTFRGTQLGELWGLLPTGNRVQAEFIDIFRIRDGLLAEHWFHFDFEALRSLMRAAQPDLAAQRPDESA